METLIVSPYRRPDRNPYRDQRDSGPEALESVPSSPHVQGSYILKGPIYPLTMEHTLESCYEAPVDSLIKGY